MNQEQEDRARRRAARNGKYTYICRVNPKQCAEVRSHLETMSDGIVRLEVVHLDNGVAIDVYLAGSDEETIGTEEAAGWAKYILGWLDGQNLPTATDLAQPRPGFLEGDDMVILLEDQEIREGIRQLLSSPAWIAEHYPHAERIVGTLYGWARGLGADHDQAASFVFHTARTHSLVEVVEKSDG